MITTSKEDYEAVHMVIRALKKAGISNLEKILFWCIMEGITSIAINQDIPELSAEVGECHTAFNLQAYPYKIDNKDVGYWIASIVSSIDKNYIVGGGDHCRFSFTQYNAKEKLPSGLWYYQSERWIKK